MNWVDKATISGTLRVCSLHFGKEKRMSRRNEGKGKGSTVRSGPRTHGEIKDNV